MVSITECVFLVTSLAAIADARFIAFSGSRCDGAGGSIVDFKSCTDLQGRHSFKFVNELPYGDTYVSLWSGVGCNNNENGYHNLVLNQCYNIDTGGNVAGGRSYDYCHAYYYGGFPLKDCPNISKHAVKRDDTNDTYIQIKEVDDSDSRPIFIEDDYLRPFNETIELIKQNGEVKARKNAIAIENENTIPDWLFQQYLELSTTA